MARADVKVAGVEGEAHGGGKGRTGGGTSLHQHPAPWLGAQDVIR
jgi:hypothetical protein